MVKPPTRHEGLTEGRIQLHWAAQALGALGASLNAPQADHSHTALEIRSGRLHVHGSGVDASLDESGALMIVRSGNARTLPLPGCPLDVVLKDLQQVLQRIGVRDPKPVQRLQHDLPQHPIGEGEAFSSFPIESGVVLRWMAYAWNELNAVSARPGLGAVRVWPHHFDVARLWELGSSQRAIGFGMSPGDGSYEDPYFYVNLWPDPGDVHLPDLIDGGHWHRQGWIGAVLPGFQVLEGRSVAAFFEDAATKAREILKRAST